MPQLDFSIFSSQILAVLILISFFQIYFTIFFKNVVFSLKLKMKLKNLFYQIKESKFKFKFI